MVGRWRIKENKAGSKWHGGDDDAKMTKNLKK